MFGGSARRRLVMVGAVLFGALFAYAAPSAKQQKFTGEVGDAMCGRKHMDGTPAECTRTCVGHGSKYALVVGDKIYPLNTTDKNALTTLDQQAGKHVTVTGALNGDELDVTSVVAAK